jgi:hypothetical protein
VVLNRAHAADILASEFSSSARSMSGDALERETIPLSAINHRCLQLGPIGRAVIAMGETRSDRALLAPADS